MGKRKFQVGDMAVVNDKVPEAWSKYIGHKVKIVRYYEQSGVYEVNGCPWDFYARELDKVKK
jgi:hypothetical protein